MFRQSGHHDHHATNAGVVAVAPAVGGARPSQMTRFALYLQAFQGPRLRIPYYLLGFGYPGLNSLAGLCLGHRVLLLRELATG